MKKKKKKRNRKSLIPIYNKIHALTIALYNVQISNYRFKGICGGTKAGERENGEGAVGYISG